MRDVGDERCFRCIRKIMRVNIAIKSQGRSPMGGWQERESAGAAEGKGKQADGLWGQGRNYGDGKIGGTKRVETKEFEGRRNSAGFASIRRGLFWNSLFGRNRGGENGDSSFKTWENW